MKKIAAFVEGQTEQIFFQRLIEEVAGKNLVQVSIQKRSEHNSIRLNIADGSGNNKFFALIYNCETDNQVKSKILESLESLTNAGYSLIVGLRDIYPNPLSDLQRVRQGLYTGVPTKYVAVKMHLAISEIEAWFVQEWSHYSRISANIDLDIVSSNLSFDPRSDSAEGLHKPSDVLGKIYNHVGMGYSKKEAHVRRTVNSLDFDRLCLDCRELVPSFGALYDDIEEFVS